jgi:hypothetical protein
MPKRENESKPANESANQEVFSGNEEKRSPFKEDHVNSEADNTDGPSDEDVYRSRNLEIEKERD